MDVHAALDEVVRWCAQQTEAGDPEAIELECHGVVCITIAENMPPWHVRIRRRCSAGASSPIAQLRYDPESRKWALHDGEPRNGWCGDDDAVHADELGALLEEIAGGRADRFQGLAPDDGVPYHYPY
jgi:hypothetical protein